MPPAVRASETIVPKNFAPKNFTPDFDAYFGVDLGTKDGRQLLIDRHSPFMIDLAHMIKVPSLGQVRSYGASHG